VNRGSCRRPAGAGLVIALAVLVPFTAGGSASASLPDPVAAQAKPCQAETKRLTAFKRKMASRRRAFFRTHRSQKQRRAFVKKQSKKLKALRRARTRCLRSLVPPPAPPPPAPASDTTPPELSIDSPTAGAWSDQPSVALRGSARDTGSGLTGVACNGQAAALAGDGFSCDVALTEGSNTIAVSATDGAGNTASAALAVNHAPGGLAGAAGASAVAAVGDIDTDPRHDEASVSTTPEGLRVARGEIALSIGPSATVQQINAALQSVDGRIVGSVAGWPQLAIGIPDPGSLAALETLLAMLRTRLGVERAELADMPATNELPPGFVSPPSSVDGPVLSHLLALRMPAAWNARAAIDLADRPTLIVADLFGNGQLSSHVDATYNSGGLIVRTVNNEHGYHVVGIAASGFSTNGSAAGNVTGVFPVTTPLQVIDAIGLSTQMTGLRIFQAATARAGHVVVNTSLGWDSPAPDSQAQQGGSEWAQLVRGSAGLEDRMLHATSAGNDAVSATRNSRWSAAALRSDLTNASGAPMTALRNTLAVENLVDTGSPAFEPSCLGISSNRGGTIAAVGEDVFSHLFGSQAGDKTGTSMASPQVAGLAMFLWSIAPDLSAPQLRDLMVATARPALPIDAGGCGSDVPSARRLDAYSAVLSLDQPVALTPQTAPVRHAIVDHDGDGTFDDDDIEAFASVARSDAGARDWSRSDLNGDGFSGGTPEAPLDLDPTGSPRGGAPQLEVVMREILGVGVEFDERNVTDMEALCFFAYSDLYKGDPARRTELLDPPRNCGAKPKFDNGKLVVIGSSPRGPGQPFPPRRLWLVDPPADPVPFTPEGETPAQAAWSPDGQRIAYSRDGAQPGISIIGAAGENPTHVPGTVQFDQEPTWSPDGQRIAFSGLGRTPRGIYIVDAAGGVPTLIPGTDNYHSPSWSPDGRKIAASTAQLGGDIVVFAPSGERQMNLTNNPAEEELAPDWSPGGSRIVFVSNRQIPGGTVVRKRLWIMDADGTDVTQFTAPFGTNTSGTTVEDHNPSWSPDGAAIAFARSHQNNSRFVMTKDLDADLAVAVTPLPMNNTDHTWDVPDWQPVPLPP
jgi:hypothetical protein